MKEDHAMALNRFTPLLAAVLLALSVPAAAAGRHQQQQYVAPLSGIEIQDLTYMREGRSWRAMSMWPFTRNGG